MDFLSESSHVSLLPMGFHDLLPQESIAEAECITRLMKIFSNHGYQPIKPPLLEYEETLLKGSGKDLVEQSFRFLDPSSHKMMVLRPDITTQISRVAGARFKHAPRPLRVSYAGETVVIGTPGREKNREIPQVGIELIGLDLPKADAEIIALGAYALKKLAIDNISFDISMPIIIWNILGKIDQERRGDVSLAIESRDCTAIKATAGEHASFILDLIDASGSVHYALEKLRALHAPVVLRPYIERLCQTIEAIRKKVPDLKLTVDPADFNGWRYHTGICFTVFSLNAHEELGRGGRYISSGEPASGLTLNPQALLGAGFEAQQYHRCLVKEETSFDQCKKLHEKGYITIPFLGGDHQFNDDAARKMQCDFIFDAGKIKKVVL